MQEIFCPVCGCIMLVSDGDFGTEQIYCHKCEQEEIDDSDLPF